MGMRAKVKVLPGKASMHASEVVYGDEGQGEGVARQRASASDGQGTQARTQPGLSSFSPLGWRRKVAMVEVTKIACSSLVAWMSARTRSEPAVMMSVMAEGSSCMEKAS